MVQKTPEILLNAMRFDHGLQIVDLFNQFVFIPDLYQQRSHLSEILSLGFWVFVETTRDSSVGFDRLGWVESPAPEHVAIGGQLIEPPREEVELIRFLVEINEVIVLVANIAIPMPNQNLQCPVAIKAIEIQVLAELVQK